MHTAYVFTKEAVPLLCRNLSKKPEYLQGDSIREAFLQKLFSRRLASSTFKLNGRILHSPSNSCPQAKKFSCMFTSCFRLNYAVEYAVEPIIINEDIVFCPCSYHDILKIMNSRSRNFFENDDELVIDFTKFNSSKIDEENNQKDSFSDFDKLTPDDPAEYEVPQKLSSESNSFSGSSDSLTGTGQNPDFSIEDNSAPEDEPRTEGFIRGFNNGFDRQPAEPSSSESETADSNANQDELFDLENFSMEGAEKQTTIYREEKDGYVIQKTVIIERKKKPGTAVKGSRNTPVQPAFNNTARIQPASADDFRTSAGGSSFLNDQISVDDPKFHEAVSILAGRDPSFHPSSDSSSSSEIPEQKPGLVKRMNEMAAKMAHRLFLLTIVTLIMVLGIFIIHSLLRPSGTEEFRKIISSVEPVKQMVEKCILDNPENFQQICNSNTRDDLNAWDLSNRFLTENRHESVANIVIEGGTITINSNYNGSLKGANYIVIPTLSPNQKVVWTVSNMSTCFAKHLC